MTCSPDPLPEVITVAELATLLRMNEKSVYDLIARGKVPGARKVGGAWRVHRPTVIDWIAGRATAKKAGAR